MGTRSTIARENADGTITAIYCHWDGYPTGVGSTLLEFYDDPAKVDALLALGALSVLGDTIGEKIPFDLDRNSLPKDDPRKYQCIAYGRDRAEKTTIHTCADRADLELTCADSWGEYCYLYTGGRWTMLDMDNPHNGYVSLDYLLQGAAA